MVLPRVRVLFAGLALVALSATGLAAELYRYQNEAGVTVVNWAIPAAYVTNGYEVLNEAGQVVRVVAPAKTDTELERGGSSPDSRRRSGG